MGPCRWHSWPVTNGRYAEFCPTDGRWKLRGSPDGRWEWEAPICSATGCLADCSTLFGTCWPRGFEEDAILMSWHDVGRGTGGWGSCSAARLVLGTACPPGCARPWDASCSGRAVAMAAAAALGLGVRGAKQKPDPQGAGHGSARKRRRQVSHHRPRHPRSPPAALRWRAPRPPAQRRSQEMYHDPGGTRTLTLQVFQNKRE
jgi:hypothetical protein